LFPPQSTLKSEQKPEPYRVPSATNLYLDFEIDGSPPARALSVLAAVIEAAAIASVLIRPAHDVPLNVEASRAIIAAVQKNGIAALVASSVDDASKLGADGIHLPWSRDIVPQFKTLRHSAPAGTVIGADAGRSRHDAMELGEAGADYVAFGVPPHVEDREKAAERQLDLIAWWSGLFEVPCVAFDVPDAGAAHLLSEAGADFVCVRLTSADIEADAIARISEFSEALRMPEPAK
jgi:thiamine-phosphate pyrophosphorylase